MRDPILSLYNITKHYPGVLAVDDVSLTIERGEVHGLVGENGAGKSTLIKILAGAVPRDEGQIVIDRQPVTIGSVQDARRLGLAFIHQELALVPYFNAAENILLGHAYPRTWYGKVNWRKLHRRAAAVLDQLGFDIAMDIPVSRLSPGQQTMIAIARAFAADARVVIMDEPTAALTQQEIQCLFAAIAVLKRRGVSVIYVSHRLNEISELADRVTVMRNGRAVTTQPAAELDRPTLIRLMTGRAVDAVFPESTAVIGEPLLAVKNLHGGPVQDVSFTLHAGEVLGVAGLIGSGRSELLRLIFGADPIQAGHVALLYENGAQKTHPSRSPQDAFRRGLALVPEERRSQGLILSRPIFENVTLTHLARYARAGMLLDRGQELAIAGQLGEALGLKAASLRQSVGQLSGGNQQKVVFARCLAGEARVLMLDEPTRGIDVGAKQELYTIIRELTARGVGVLLVSSELPEVLGLADRILVLHEGRQVTLLDAAQTTPGQLLHACYGVV